MNRPYHIQMTKEALGDRFAPEDLQVIVKANLGQDRLVNLIGHPEIHFDDSDFAGGVSYIQEQRRLAVDAVVNRRDRMVALVAFGRLLHGCQDFYAHSNWIRLWVEAQGGLQNCSSAAAELCPDPLAVPGLISGTGSAWRYVLYRIPLLGNLVKSFYLPPNSHEAMNLDTPKQGPLFPLAIVAATKHTRFELDRLLDAITAAGGEEGVAYFLGQEMGPAS